MFQVQALNVFIIKIEMMMDSYMKNIPTRF